MRNFALSFFAAVALIAPIAMAQEFPASWKFVVLRTPHFDVIVNAQQQELGRFYAVKLEKAFAAVTPNFTSVPQHIPVVIADKTDSTNAYATRLPYSHIFVYPVLPGPQDSLSEAGDWGFELVAHEYTHILTFDAVSGGAKTLESIFGSILSPNLLMPLWWKEGAAVERETAVSNGGRLRSAYQDGMLRAFAEANTLKSYDLAQINEILPDWPQGQRPYMFGALFWSQVVAEKGAGAMDAFFQRQGGRVPYFVETPAVDILGSDYERFYEKTLQEVQARASAQITSLKVLPVSESTLLKIKADAAFGPRISPDGLRMALVATNHSGRRSLRILKRARLQDSFVDAEQVESFVNRHEVDSQPVKDGPPAGSISRVAWLDNDHLVFDKVDSVSLTESYSDLWIFDTTSGKTERLTFALRAREPSPSHDGRRIWFTGLDGGRTWLGFYDLGDKLAHRVWTSGFQERIAFPSEMPDGQVVFSLRHADGHETLDVWPSAGGSPREFLTNYPNARFPEAIGGRLYFTSSKSGVHNVYAADFGGDLSSLKIAKPVTHVLTSAFTYARDAQGDFYVTEMTAQGPFVHFVPAAEVARVEKNSALPVVPPIFADRYPAVAMKADPSVEIETEEYRPQSYLLPHYWLPMYEISAVNNSLIFEASTSGFDPLKKHVYSITGTYDTSLNEPGYAVGYQNNVWPASISLASSRIASYFVTPDVHVITSSASALVVPDVFRWSRFLTFGVGGQWSRTDYAGAGAERAGPTAVMQYTDFSRSGDQISPTDGGSLSFSAVDYLGGSNRLDYRQYIAGGNFFWSKWLPDRHAIALRAAAEYTDGDLSPVYGIETTNFFLQQDPPNATFVMRGYRVGHFFGKTMNNAGAEYRFPIAELRKGNGTDPWYLLRVHGAAFVDALNLYGYAYRPAIDALQFVRPSQVFTSAGAEVRLESTIGYVIPLNFIFGYAVPSPRDFSDGAGFYSAIQMGTLF